MVAGKLRSSTPSWSGKGDNRNSASVEEKYDEEFRRQMEAERNQKLLEDEAAAWLMSPASSSSSTSPSFSFSQRFITAAATAASSSTSTSSSQVSIVSSPWRSSPTPLSMLSDKDDRSNSCRRHFFPSEFTNVKEEARSPSTNSTTTKSSRTESMQSRSRSTSITSTTLQRKESIKERAIRERMQSMQSQRSVKVGANHHHQGEREASASAVTVTPTGGGGGTKIPDEMRVSPATIMSTTTSSSEGDGDTTLRSLSTRTKEFPVEKEFQNKLLISVVSSESGTSSSDHTRSKAKHSRQLQNIVDNKKCLAVDTALPPRADKKFTTDHPVATRESPSQHNNTPKSDSDSSQRSTPMSFSSKMQSIGQTSSATMHSCPTDERTVENKRFFAPSSSCSSSSSPRPGDVIQQDCSSPECIEIEMENNHFFASSSSALPSPIDVEQKCPATQSIETEEVARKKKKFFGRRRSSSALETLKIDLRNGLNRQQGGSRRKTFGYTKIGGREGNVEEETFNNTTYSSNSFPKAKETVKDKDTTAIQNQEIKTKILVQEQTKDDPRTSSSSQKRRQHQTTTMPVRTKANETMKDKDTTTAATAIYRQAMKTKIVMVKEKTKNDPLTSSSSHKRRQQQTTTMPVRTNRIKLNVYDLLSNEVIMPLPWGIEFPIGQCFGVVNSGLHNLGTGAYHVGVEINGVEYAYGCNHTEGATGIFSCMPQNSPGYQYRTTIDLGERVLIRDVVKTNNSSHEKSCADNTVPKKRHVDGREVIREMAEDYMGMDYDLLRKNCCTFAHDACLRLGLASEEIPSWFRNLCSAGALAQDAANMKFEPLTEVVSKWSPDIDIDAPFDNACNLIGHDPNLLPNNENDIDVSNTKKG